MIKHKISLKYKSRSYCLLFKTNGPNFCVSVRVPARHFTADCWSLISWLELPAIEPLVCDWQLHTSVSGSQRVFFLGYIYYFKEKSWKRGMIMLCLCKVGGMIYLEFMGDGGGVAKIPRRRRRGAEGKLSRKECERGKSRSGNGKWREANATNLTGGWLTTPRDKR